MGYHGGMASFPGGSPYAMVREIAGGFLQVNERTFRRFQRGELDRISHELERHIRHVRGEQLDSEDSKAVQMRNRSLQRLTGARMMLQQFRIRFKT